MNPNRRWVALAYFVFGMLGWILIDKLIAWVMALVGAADFNWELAGERFTLTTLVGLVIALSVTLWAWRHPTLSTLSNEVIVELKKVTWPTAQETRGATVVVIITVFIMAVFLGLFDLIWSSFMDFIYPNVQAG
jgi:preprotein translocase subunit SecE